MKLGNETEKSGTEKKDNEDEEADFDRDEGQEEV